MYYIPNFILLLYCHTLYLIYQQKPLRPIERNIEFYFRFFFFHFPFQGEICNGCCNDKNGSPNRFT